MSGTVPTVMPPLLTNMWPPLEVGPLLTIVPDATPPLSTYSTPPPLTVVPLATPPAKISCCPPLITTVRPAEPPPERLADKPADAPTFCTPPLNTERGIGRPPEKTFWTPLLMFAPDHHRRRQKCPGGRR